MNTFGSIFRVTTFGESHGHSVGAVVDGCPPGHKINFEVIERFLARRRPGQSDLTSPRAESEAFEILSGLENGITLGSPITITIKNKDKNPSDYDAFKDAFRPSHADYTYLAKYGIAAASGGGRASARETASRVAAAAIAEQILSHLVPEMQIVAFVQSVHKIQCGEVNIKSLSREQVDQSIVRCPDLNASQKMEDLIRQAKANGDSVGGVIRCVVKNPPVGLGTPVFDKLEADLGKAMLSIPSTKGFEIGSGFSGTQLYGSEHNDAFAIIDGKVGTTTNHSGGIQGGISNGQPIVFNVAFKPVSTIFKAQDTLTKDLNETVIQPREGRHDPCVLPRAVPIVEAMTLLTLADHFLRQQAIVHSRFK
ncbi:MAG: chorismate synthase [Oligoflexales bacterium]